MLKIEFEEIANTNVSDEDYRFIEQVYLYLDPSMDKFQFCELYKTGGMALMCALQPQAERNKRVQEIENRQRQIKKEIQALMEKMFELHDEEKRLDEELGKI